MFNVRVCFYLDQFVSTECHIVIIRSDFFVVLIDVHWSNEWPTIFHFPSQLSVKINGKLTSKMRTEEFLLAELGFLLLLGMFVIKLSCSWNGLWLIIAMINLNVEHKWVLIFSLSSSKFSPWWLRFHCLNLGYVINTAWIGYPLSLKG